MISLQPFGLFLFAGIGAAYLILLFRPALAHISRDPRTATFMSHLLWSCLIGARLLYWFELHPVQANTFAIARLYTGGFSSQGALIGALLLCAYYIARYGLPMIWIIDGIASCAPLFQAIARLGCLSVGCCYGTKSSVIWAITYTNPTSFAPLHVPLHPTQLYSAIALFALFIAIQIPLHYLLARPGLTTAIYVFFACLERCMVDFVRGDHTAMLGCFSLSQLVAIACGSLALTVALILCREKQTFTYERIRKS